MGRYATCAWLAVVLCGSPAMAQEAEPPADAPAAEAPAESPTGDAPKENEVVTPSEAVTTSGSAWKDIFVVPRRAILKRRRLEIMPTYNVTMNNSLVRHHGLGGQLNFWISEALFVGLEGTWYERDLMGLTGRYFLIGLDQRVLASVNRYKWSAFLDFGYVPIQGKFALFNAAVLHWDVYISGGVGVIETEIIPKDPANPGFGGFRIAGLLPGIGTHLWFNRWLGLDVYIKDYIFSDKLEPTTRTKGDCVSSKMCEAADKAPSQFTFDLVFGVGLSVMLPPSYEYRTAR